MTRDETDSPARTTADTGRQDDLAEPTIAIYDAAQDERVPIQAWRTMFAEIWRYRELVYRLVVRDTAGRFRQSVLGILWLVFPPIATTLIFTFLRRNQVLKVGETGLPYPVFVLIGSTLWTFFSGSLVKVSGSIATSGSLVSKIYFPREVLALQALGSEIINLGVRLTVVAVTLIAYKVVPCWQAAFAPFVLLPLAALALGLGLIAAPINTMVRDTTNLLTFVLTFGMFLAPTIYPTPDGGLLWLVHTINPASHFLNAARDLLHLGCITNAPEFALSCAVSFVTLAVGWRFFHVCEPLLAERL